MTKFAEKLKGLRKQFNLSQEQLAEKIGVSRQAITKWETDGGMPDIDNLMAIASLFSVTMDDLLSAERQTQSAKGYAYESATEYDVVSPVHFDIHAPGATAVSVSASDSEKLRVVLKSNVIRNIEKEYKVKIDERRSGLDVDIKNVGKISEAEAKGALFIDISLPADLCAGSELEAYTDTLKLSGLTAPFELDGKVSKVTLNGASGKVSLNSGNDMDITCDALPESLEVNQISATSTIHIPRGSDYRVKVKGKTNRVNFAIDGKPSERKGSEDGKYIIELAGMNAELLIDETA